MTETIAPLAGAQDFERWFTEAWELPKPDAFCAAILASVTDDVTSVQPMIRTARGPKEFTDVFRGLFRLLPDAQAIPDRVVVDGDTVVVVATVRGTAAGRPVTFRVSDHFTLRDGKLAARETFTDPLALLGQLALRPKAWPAALRMTRSR